MKNLLVALAFLYAFVLPAQDKTTDSVLDSAVLNINRQIKLFPQERLYLHTDKPYYMTGENIYFRAYLADALQLNPVSYSRYVYVELINPIDSVVSRLKVRPDEGAYYGQLSLPEELPEGMYRLRAYTNFMRNVGEEYFFSKNIRIGDPNSLSIDTHAEFSFDEAGKVRMRLRFTDRKMGEPVPLKKILTRLNDGKSREVKPDKEGAFNLRFDFPHDATRRMMYLELDASRTYRQYLRIPYPKDDYEVSFFPEGGSLIEGVLCNVAFKALKSNGLPEDVEGEVYNSQGESVGVFSTILNGMGSFVVSFQAGEKYVAVCKNKEGLEKRFDLPEMRNDTYALKLNVSRGKIWASVNKPEGLAGDSLYLLVHSRGRLQYAQAWDFSKEFLLFNEQQLPGGILSFLLLSSDMRPLSERLVFVGNDELAGLSLHTDKEAYRRRERVELTAKLSDLTGQAPGASFSVSVTDDREVELDTCLNIYAYLLLSSELKGYIHCPACYFQEGKLSAVGLDLLMMTQGWRRYDIPRAARREFVPLIYPLEAGQEIGGLVKGGLLSKPSEKAKVSILSPERKYLDMTETGKDGRFYFRGFEFPDSTKYVVHATSKRGRKTVELYVDRDSFPDSSLSWVYTLPVEDRSFQEYIEKADRKYSYENGMRLINLDEVTVRGSNRREEDNRRGAIYGMADNTLSEKDIERSGFNSVRDMLYRFPGVQVGPDYIRVRGASGNPMLLVDNMEMDIEMLDDLNVQDIAQVDLLKSGANLAMFGSRGGNGVISIFTKRGEVTFRDNLMNVVVHQPLGYHHPAAFYSPRYDTAEMLHNDTPDLRSTLYWNPSVKTDGEGRVVLDFYTADTDNTSYSITIEGLTEEGKIIHYSGKIKRE